MAKRILASGGDDCCSITVTNKTDPVMTPESIMSDENGSQNRFHKEFQGVKGSQVAFHYLSEDSNMSCEEPLNYSPRPTCLNENFYTETPNDTHVLNSLLEFSSKESSRVYTCDLNIGNSK